MPSAPIDSVSERSAIVWPTALRALRLSASLDGFGVGEVIHVACLLALPTLSVALISPTSRWCPGLKSSALSLAGVSGAISTARCATTCRSRSGKD